MKPSLFLMVLPYQPPARFSIYRRIRFHGFLLQNRLRGYMLKAQWCQRGGRTVAEDFKHSFKTDRRGELSLWSITWGFEMSAGIRLGTGRAGPLPAPLRALRPGHLRDRRRTFVLHSGEAFLARPDVPIFYRADDRNPWEYYWVGFSGPAAPLLLAQTPFTAACPGPASRRGGSAAAGAAGYLQSPGVRLPRRRAHGGISAGCSGSFDGGGPPPGAKRP